MRVEKIGMGPQGKVNSIDQKALPVLFSIEYKFGSTRYQL